MTEWIAGQGGGEARPADYFDTLPLHPPPEPLESLTGYLTRLGEENTIRSLRDLERLLFPSAYILFLQRLTDYTVAPFEGLARATGVCESRLTETTFVPLGRKFGLPTTSMSVGEFLSDSITGSLRYCPACLGERPYRRLAWRLNLLAGCPVHRCRLVAQCPHGAHTIPLLAAPFRVTSCARCGGDLRAATPEPLAEAEWRQVCRRSDDLEYLLTPQPWEEEGDAPAAALGRMLYHVRTVKMLTRAQVASRTGLSAYSVYAIETRDRQRGSVALRAYVQYVEFLGSDLRGAFDVARRHRDLIDVMHPTISRLRVYAMPKPAQPGPEQALPPDGIDWYPSSIHILVDQLPAARVRQREDVLLARIHDALGALRSRGDPITRKAIWDEMGERLGSMVPYPRLKALLAEVVPLNGGDRPRRRNQAAWIAALDEAIAWCRAQGQAVSDDLVRERLHLAPNAFRQKLQRAPALRAILHAASTDIPAGDGAVSGRQGTQDEETLIAQVRWAHDSLEADGSPATVDAICAMLGIPAKCLHASLGIGILLDQWKRDARARRAREQIARREEDLLERVQSARRLLQEGGTPLTVGAIAAAVGMSEPGLQRYPRVRAVLRMVVEANLAPLTEVEVLAKIEEAIGALRAAGKTVSQGAICRHVHMYAKTLSRYPRVKAVLRQVVLEGPHWRRAERERPTKA